MGDKNVQISLDKIADLAVEHWRLSSSLKPILEKASSAPLRHALRKMEDFFASCQIEVRSLDGQPYDAGLAARVIDTVPDAALEKGEVLITETLSPLVLHERAVLRPADVVISTHA